MGGGGGAPNGSLPAAPPLTLPAVLEDAANTRGEAAADAARTTEGEAVAIVAGCALGGAGVCVWGSGVLSRSGGSRKWQSEAGAPADEAPPLPHGAAHRARRRPAADQSTVACAAQGALAIYEATSLHTPGVISTPRPQVETRQHARMATRPCMRQCPPSVAVPHCAAKRMLAPPTRALRTYQPIDLCTPTWTSLPASSPSTQPTSPFLLPTLHPGMATAQPPS